MVYVGQKVVCVSLEDNPLCSGSWNKLCDVPVLGKTYTVRAIGCDADGIAGIKLEELIWRGRVRGRFIEDGHYWAKRFRPVVEKSTDAGMAILKEILERETVRYPQREFNVMMSRRAARTS